MLEYDPEREIADFIKGKKRRYSSAFKRLMERAVQDMNNYNPYPTYLSASELCTQSGLAPSDLSRLEAARLLLTDRSNGSYRPKLVGWARKLAYLLAEGWSLDEIRAWAKGRWSAPDPRAWPPDRATWRIPQGSA